MLSTLCVKMGFCGDANHAPFDRSCTSWTADEFALEVLRAEGLNPLIIEGIGPSQSEYFVLIRDAFVSRFGETVGVKDFDGEA